MPKNCVRFVEQEIALLLGVAASADPDEWVDDKTKAAIYKARTVVEELGDGRIYIHPFSVIGRG